MDAFSSLMSGFSAALTPTYIAMCFLGVLLGQIVGVLPGIGPAAAIALLLPITFGMDATGAIIMFAGIYYGSQYGGTLTSVLISVPGESSTVMTAVDGYQMAFFESSDVSFGASGALVVGDVYRPSHQGCFLYFGVESIDETVARALEHGGSVLYPKKSNGDLGFVAEIEDTEGNRIALHQETKTK